MNSLPGKMTLFATFWQFLIAIIFDRGIIGASRLDAAGTALKLSQIFELSKKISVRKRGQSVHALKTGSGFLSRLWDRVSWCI